MYSKDIIGILGVVVGWVLVLLTKKNMNQSVKLEAATVSHFSRAWPWKDFFLVLPPITEQKNRDTNPIMVLNKREPYLTESSDDEVLSWEMIVDGEGGEQRPSIHTTTDDDDGGDSPLDNDVSVGVTISDGDTFVSGVSSITGEFHAAVSDVEDGDDDDEDEEDDGGGGATENGGRQSPSPDDALRAGGEEEGPPPTADDPLVCHLSEMGFEVERVAEAIAALRASGSTEIDADSVIGSMVGEAPTAAAAAAGTRRPNNGHPLEPLLGAWELVGSTIAREWDERGRPAGCRTADRVRAAGRSARDAWTSVADESHRLVRRLVSNDDDGRDDDDDVVRAGGADRYSAATAQASRRPPAASSAKDAFRRANEEHRIVEKLVAVAVVGSAALLALGNPRASLGAMAVAGAGLAAGEAMRQTASEQRGGGAPCGDGGASSRGHGLHLD